ncbi:hypothetical protein GCM10010191_48020 [Actinomadura vinacea]|uniref:Alpha/beta hydrolase n=1 Tax=Actinomadura vinacea TaxID=115336 RepID=A0ABN3JIM7_9ACTN
MTPGTLVLLHAPYARPSAWGDLPEMLRLHGLDVITPDVPDSSGPRYVARASLVISATAPTAPLVLVAHGGAGPLLPGIALAQRAAHRKIGGFVFLDAELPRTARHRHDHDEAAVPVPPDWPEAPCGYLRGLKDGGDARGGESDDQAVREARLRGWPVAEPSRGISLARALKDLIASL